MLSHLKVHSFLLDIENIVTTINLLKHMEQASWEGTCLAVTSNGNSIVNKEDKKCWKRRAKGWRDNHKRRRHCNTVQTEGNGNTFKSFHTSVVKHIRYKKKKKKKKNARSSTLPTPKCVTHFPLPFFTPQTLPSKRFQLFLSTGSILTALKGLSSFCLWFAETSLNVKQRQILNNGRGREHEGQNATRKEIKVRKLAKIKVQRWHLYKEETKTKKKQKKEPRCPL